MAQSSKERPLPVTGVVFARSAAKTFGLLLLSILCLLFGALLIWAKIVDLEFASKKVTWWGLLIGIGCLLGGPMWAYALIRAFWLKRRLIVGDDRLQILEERAGQDSVVLQLPYDNIATVQYEVTKTNRRVAIDLLDLEDEETYAPGTRFSTNQVTEGRHYCVEAGFQSGPRKIADTIESAFGRWKQETQLAPSKSIQAELRKSGQ
jgi:hypothetical protein